MTENRNNVAKNPAHSTNNADDTSEMETIKARKREMEEEVEKLKELQAELDKQWNMSSPSELSKLLLTLFL